LEDQFAPWFQKGDAAYDKNGGFWKAWEKREEGKLGKKKKTTTHQTNGSLRRPSENATWDKRL